MSKKAKYLSEKSKKKSLVIVVSLVLVMMISVIGTVAYLVTDTDPVVNTFTPADYDIEINETLEGNMKKDVKVKNDGEVPMYIRVALIVTYTDADGKVIPAPASVETSGFPTDSVEGTNGDWIKNGNYWYYNQVVNPSDYTDAIITEAQVTQLPKGVEVNLEVLAQGIQAEPKQAVIDAWGVDPTALN